MSFEQAYEQFAEFRHKMQIKWNRMPMDMEDLKQEIDIGFYKTYQSYNENLADKVLFTTHIFARVNSHMYRLLRDMNANKRATNFRTISYNVALKDDDNKELSFEDKICQVDSFEEETSFVLDIKRAIDKLSDRDKKIIKMLEMGYIQSEVGKEIGYSQIQVSRFRSRILKKLKEEIAV